MRAGMTLVLVFVAAPALRPLAAQCPDGTPPPCAARAVTARAPGANSVAVLLFENLTHDSTAAYLSDGLASEISTSLARVPRLEVRSPGAVRAAQRGGEADPQAIGRRLSVRYVVEGDFQRGGDRIRVSVRLVTVQNGTQRWTTAFTRPMADLLAVQEEVASAVATAIAGELLPQERTAITTRVTRNAEAYDRLLRGNFYLAQRSPAGVRRAIDEYTAAAHLDSTLAPAYARIGLGYALYVDWGWQGLGIGRDSAVACGFRAAERALATDSSSSDAWVALAYLRSFRDPRAYAGVIPALERATRLDPRNAEAWHQYASFVSALGRYQEAQALEQRSIEVEPQRAISYLQMGQLGELMRNDAEAERWYDSALAAAPEFYAAWTSRSLVRLRRGDVAGARADAEAAVRTSPTGDEHYGLSAMAAVAAREGDTTMARGFADRALAMLSGRRMDVFPATNVAIALLVAGETSRALDVLERAEPRGLLLWVSIVPPVFDPLRSEPRYQRLIAEIQPPGAR
jgi:TolB-like protein/Tfp pilus assembly protein PilF